MNNTAETAYFAGGCFWGMEHYFQNAPGVISTKVGYMGGHTEHPTYAQVCKGNTGHLETLEVSFDPAKTSYENLSKLFFEIHDFTQADGQGPDIGEQYLSAVFYQNPEQKNTAEKLIEILKSKDYNVVTQLRTAGQFWEAEDYHQRYYEKNGEQPYCHFRKKIF